MAEGADHEDGKKKKIKCVYGNTNVNDHWFKPPNYFYLS